MKIEWKKISTKMLRIKLKVLKNKNKNKKLNT